MKSILVVKLNNGAWMDFRDKLIAKFRAMGTLDTYSDDMVKTFDTTYVGKVLPVSPHFLDPLLGFEGHCDASDLRTYLESLLTALDKDYLKEKVTLEPDPAVQTASIPTPPAQLGTAAPTAPENTQPPVDNDHVAPGAEQFDSAGQATSKPMDTVYGGDNTGNPSNVENRPESDPNAPDAPKADPAPESQA